MLRHHIHRLGFAIDAARRAAHADSTIADEAARLIRDAEMLSAEAEHADLSEDKTFVPHIEGRIEMAISELERLAR